MGQFEQRPCTIIPCDESDAAAGRHLCLTTLFDSTTLFDTTTLLYSTRPPSPVPSPPHSKPPLLTDPDCLEGFSAIAVR